MDAYVKEMLDAILADENGKTLVTLGDTLNGVVDLLKQLPPSRELSLAITRLEEATLWFAAHCAKIVGKPIL